MNKKNTERKLYRGRDLEEEGNGEGKQKGRKGEILEVEVRKRREKAEEEKVRASPDTFLSLQVKEG